LAWAVLVDRAELLFQKSPVDRPCQLHQRVVHIDDLIEPRTKQILLAALPPFPWPHRNPSARPHQAKRSTASDSRESQTRIRKKIDHQAPISGKFNHSKSDDSYCQSIASGYFTDDWISFTNRWRAWMCTRTRWWPVSGSWPKARQGGSAELFRLRRISLWN